MNARQQQEVDQAAEYLFRNDIRGSNRLLHQHQCMNQHSQTQACIREAVCVMHQQQRMNQDTARWEEICLADCLAHQDQTLNCANQERAWLWYATWSAESNDFLVHTAIAASDAMGFDRMSCRLGIVRDPIDGDSETFKKHQKICKIPWYLLPWYFCSPYTSPIYDWYQVGYWIEISWQRKWWYRGGGKTNDEFIICNTEIWDMFNDLQNKNLSTL